jgi:hypothetical protein
MPPDLRDLSQRLRRPNLRERVLQTSQQLLVCLVSVVLSIPTETHPPLHARYTCKARFPTANKISNGNAETHLCRSRSGPHASQELTIAVNIPIRKYMPQPYSDPVGMVGIRWKFRQQNRDFAPITDMAYCKARWGLYSYLQEVTGHR